MLGRVMIYTKKIDEMVGFYTMHFGFDAVRRADDRLIELIPKDGGATLLLHPATAKQKHGQVLVKLIFDVKDVPAFKAAAETKGLRFGTLHQADGYMFANAKDPSGNPVQISSRAFVGR